MRITQNMINENFMRNLSKNLRRLGDKNDMISSTKKIRRPSDDPVGAAMVMKLRRQVSAIEQYKSNAEDALSWMKTTESTLTNVGDMMHRLKELSVQAANGPLTADDRNKILYEVKEIKEQILNEANATHVDRHLFSGYNTDKPPFITQEVGGKTVIVVNPDIPVDENAIDYNLGKSDSITINLVGPKVFEGIFETLQDFETALDQDDQDTLSSNILRGIDDASSQILKYRAQVGARYNRMEATIARLDINSDDYRDLLSKTEDIDVAGMIMELKMEEAVYRLALSAGARIIQPNLADFLR